MYNKQLYEKIMMSVAKEVKKALNENTYEYDDAILEKYGLSSIFVLNEGESINIFQKFKQPLQNTLNKVKNAFGNRPCKVIADIIKKAQAKGHKTLYGVLTAITLLSNTLSAGAITTSGFDTNLRDSVVQSTISMGKAQNLQSETDWNSAKESAVNDFTNILYTLETDSENRYGACGVGCSESLSQAQQMAQQDVEKALKEKYGENAIQEYEIKFKTVQNKSYTKTLIHGISSKTITYYTVIIVAYQAIN